jgi:pimeloyl-ACP methyl ester carboxylesterase
LRAYFISGLGADARIFANVRLPAHVAIHHVPWLEPEKNEPLQAYCRRMALGLRTDEPFILVGLSFGGLVAIEWNRFLRPAFTFILSSVTTDKDFPWTFRLIKAFGLQRVSPSLLKKIPSPLYNWIFGAYLPEEKRMLRSFLREVTPSYLSWSMNAVLTWRNPARPPKLLHLHGSEDRIFPRHSTHADVWIEHTGHFMAYDHADEVNKVMALHLEKNGL